MKKKKKKVKITKEWLERLLEIKGAVETNNLPDQYLMGYLESVKYILDKQTKE